MNLVKLGTRKSRLALWQADHVIEQLQDTWPDLTCEKVSFMTQGDKTLDKPFFLLAKLGTWDERDIALGIALSCYCTVGYRDFP